MDNAYLPPKRKPEPCQRRGCTNRLIEPSFAHLWSRPEDGDNTVGIKPPDFEGYGQPRPNHWIFFRYKCIVCLHEFSFFDYCYKVVDGRELEKLFKAQSRQGSLLPTTSEPNAPRSVARGNVTRQAAGHDPASQASSWNPLDNTQPGVIAGSSASRSIGSAGPSSVNSTRGNSRASGRFLAYPPLSQASSTQRLRIQSDAQVPLLSLTSAESRLNLSGNPCSTSLSPASTTSRGSQHTRLVPYPPGLDKKPVSRPAGISYGGKRFQDHPFKGWKYFLFHEFRGGNIPQEQKVFTCFACQAANKGCRIEHIRRQVLENPHELVRKHLENCPDPEQLYNSAPYLRGLLALQPAEYWTDDHQMN